MESTRSFDPGCGAGVFPGPAGPLVGRAGPRPGADGHSNEPHSESHEYARGYGSIYADGNSDRHVCLRTHLHRNSKPHGDPGANRDGHGNADRGTHRGFGADRDGNGNAIAPADGYSHPSPYRYTPADGDSYLHGHSHRDGHCGSTDAYDDAHPHTYPIPGAVTF